MPGSPSTTSVLALALGVSLALSPADAHGYISLPAATYRDTSTKTRYNAILTESANPAFQGRKWNDSPENNERNFAESFPQTGLPSLRALLAPAAPGCGNSRTDVPPVDVSSLSVMQFQNDEYSEGFISSHHGPCEVWIDETRVFHGDDCAAQFRGAKPASIPVNYAVCPAGQTCTLTFYWLALHEPNWQVYKQCVPITRGQKRALLRQ